MGIKGFKITYAEGGPKGMVLGWAPTAIGYSAQGLCKFGFYEVFKDLYSKAIGEENTYLYRTSLYLAALQVLSSLLTLLFLQWRLARLESRPHLWELSQQ